MTVSPLLMPARRPVPVALPVRLAWTTSTGDAPLPPVRDNAWGCPGCDGEASKAVGAALGCTLCVLQR